MSTTNIEKVLVISKGLAESLCNYEVWGKPSPILEQVILQNHTFRERPEAETNFEFKQVIPYVVVRHSPTKSYLLSQRLSKQAEKRLHDKFTLGQGGHINPEDMFGKSPLVENIKRELHEEFAMGYTGCSVVGLINDDSNEVGKVHLGLVYLMESTCCVVKVGAEEKDHHRPEFLPVARLAEYYDRMESWSQIVYDRIIQPSI